MNPFDTRTVTAAAIALLLIGAAPSAEAANKVAFITSVDGTGDLSSWVDASGETGLVAADTICQARAAAAGLANPSDFVAWLSDSSDDAYCRVHGFSGKKDSNCGQPALPTGAGPWVRTDGFPVGDTIEHLLYSENAVLVPIYLDEFGNGDLALGRKYFTDTYQTGTFFSSYTACANWTSAGHVEVRAGDSTMTAEGWTTGETVYCDDSQGLLCMEKGAGDPMPPFQSSGARVFLTFAMGPGDLGAWTQAGGAESAAAGDAICQRVAADAGLAASFDFRAWLSTTTLDPNDAIDRFYYDGPWVRLDGVPVANSKADLVDGELFAPINLTDTGQYLSSYSAWTGTLEDGTAAVWTCDDWSDGTVGQSGRIGIAYYAVGGWTNRYNAACDFALGRLYCFCQEVVMFADNFESGDTGAW